MAYVRGKAKPTRQFFVTSGCGTSPTAGLVQLLFFSESRNAEARQILADSTNPKRYFPFAAAGWLVFGFRRFFVAGDDVDKRGAQAQCDQV